MIKDFAFASARATGTNSYPEQYAAAQLLTIPLETRVATETLENFFTSLEHGRRYRRRDGVIAHTIDVFVTALEKQFAAANPDDLQKHRMGKKIKLLSIIAAKLDSIDLKRSQIREPDMHHSGHGPMVMAVQYILERERLEREGYSAEEYIHVMQKLIDALRHDLGHDGTTNSIRRRGMVYTKLNKTDYGRLELASNQILVKQMNQLQSFEEALHSQWVVYSTDPTLPGEIRKSAFAYYFEDGSDPRGGIAVLPFAEIMRRINDASPENQIVLRRYMVAMGRDEDLVMDATSINPADMHSFGLTEAYSTRICNDFDRETQKNNSGIRIVDAQSKPILYAFDDDGNSIGGQIDVALKYVGARINDDKIITICFLYPPADRLLGSNLDALMRSMQFRMPQKKLEKTLASFSASYHAFDETDRQGWNEFLASAPAAPVAMTKSAAGIKPAVADGPA